MIDSDEEESPKRDRDYNATINRMEIKINDTRDDMESVKKALKDIVHLNSKSKLPYLS